MQINSIFLAQNFSSCCLKLHDCHEVPGALLPRAGFGRVPVETPCATMRRPHGPGKTLVGFVSQANNGTFSYVLSSKCISKWLWWHIFVINCKNYPRIELFCHFWENCVGGVRKTTNYIWKALIDICIWDLKKSGNGWYLPILQGHNL